MNIVRFLPGTLLSAAIALLAAGLAHVETWVLGRAWLEPMVLAILLGMLVGNLWRLPRAVRPGVRFSAKTLLDIAVALLGATLSWTAVQALGARTFLIIAALVLIALVLAYLLGRAVGLGRRLSLLIAAGNAICGNSAIAAVAPVIGARAQDVAAAIALTALIGVVTVLALPVAVWTFGMELSSYAVLAGLTAYAVPQVVAAAAPFGTATLTLATLVKLARVVMLGPLTLLLSVVARRQAAHGGGRGRASLYLPWFIIAFALLAALRSVGLLDDRLAAAMGSVSRHMATIAMAALGLQVQLSTLRQVGRRVALASALAALLMVVLALGAVHLTEAR